MKKTLHALCAAALLALSACGDDSHNPSTTPDATSGIYSPAQKVDHVMPAEGAPELWLWDGDLLEALADNDLCGGYTEKCWLNYDGKRLVSMQSSLEGMPYDVDYAYAGGRLKGVYASSLGVDVLAMQLAYGADKHVNRVDIDLNPTLLGLLSAYLYDFEGVNITAASASMGLDWQGDNVACRVLTTQVDATVTFGQVKEMVDLEALAGAFAAALDPDSTLLPLQITLTDSSVYTYDNHPNPLCGLLTTPDVAVLCANNMLSIDSHPTVLVATSLPTPLGNLPVSYPLPAQTTHDSYSYTYTPDGFPADVMQHGEIIKTYIYKQ